MNNKNDILKLWCPVNKDSKGDFVAILSDTSMDRDGEFMSKELLQNWASNNTLKALANHDNKMQSWIGGWENLRTVTRGNHTALVGKPWFFSKEANPLAEMVRLQAEEALKKGENPGISIGAIPKESITKDVDGSDCKVYTKAELVEATWVPIQSNRSASYGHIAKQFNLEENKMSEEVKEPVAEIKEPVAEVKEPVAEVKEAVSEPVAEVKEAAIMVELNKVKKELADLKNKSVLPKAFETKNVEVPVYEATMENIIKARLGSLNK